MSAKDKATNKEQKITISHSSGIPQDEIDQMVKDAEKNAEEDKKKFEEVQARNQLDSLVYNTEKLMTENKDKLPENEVKPLEDALAAAKKALESGDLEAMKKETENLNQASHKLAEVMYKAQGAAPGADATADAYRFPFFQEAYFVNDVERACENWNRLYGAGPFVVVPHHQTDTFTYRGTNHGGQWFNIHGHGKYPAYCDGNVSPKRIEPGFETLISLPRVWSASPAL